MARIAPIICLLALFAACGGGGNDEEEVEQTIRDFVTAVNERDTDTYCDELITEEFRERSTFAKGDKARESCKRTLKATTGLKVELERVGTTKISGDKATANVVFLRSGQRVNQKVTLEKDGGDWKIAGGAG